MGFRVAVVAGLVMAAAVGALTVPTLAVADVPALPATGGYLPITSVRVVDTRDGEGAQQRQLGPGSQVSFDASSAAGGAAVSAVMLNVTVTGEVAPGFVTAYPLGESLPATSTVNYIPNRDIANAALVGIGDAGRVTLYNGGSEPVDVIVDVTGYELGGGTRALDGATVAVPPRRLFDSRQGTPGSVGIAAGRYVTVPTAGIAGVPSSGVAGLVLNVTATDENGAGSVSDDPSGSSSNLNYTRGTDVAGLVFAQADDGSVTIGNNGPADVELVIDIEGYVVGPHKSPAVSTVPAPDSTVLITVNEEFNEPYQPVRAVDTRLGTGTPGIAAVPADGALAVHLTGSVIAPEGASAVIATVTATDATQPGHLSVRSGVGSPPPSSTVNYNPGVDVANAAIISVDSNGVAQIFNGGAAPVDVVIDVDGYIAGSNTKASSQVRQSLPADMVVGPQQFDGEPGQVFVSAPFAGAVDVYDATGIYTSSMTGYGKPEGLLEHGGNLYIADAGNGVIYQDHQVFATIAGVERLAWAGGQMWATAPDPAAAGEFELWRISSDGTATRAGSGYRVGGEITSSPTDASSLYLADTDDGGVLRYNVSTGTPVLEASMGSNKIVGLSVQLAVSPDGTTLAVATGTGVVDLDAQTLQLKVQHSGTPLAVGVAFSPDGSTFATAQRTANPDIVSGTPTPDTVVRTTASDTPLVSIGGAGLPMGVPHGVAFDADGRRLYVLSAQPSFGLPSYRLSSYDLVPPAT